jgi:uncharacterized protein YlaI
MNKTYIYLVENCFGDPNSVYIGKTKNSRKNNHKRTYGNCITYTIIDEINSLDSKIWKPIETMWIQTFILWGFNVLNIRKEGGGGSSEWTDEQKDNHSNIKKGVPLLKLRGKESKRKGTFMEDESKKKIANKAKQRYEEGKMYFPLQNPESAKKSGLSKKGKNQSQEHINKRIEKITGKKRTEETKSKISEAKKKQTFYSNPERCEKISKSKMKKILQFTKTGEFIREWNSIMDIKKQYPSCDITYACKDFKRTSCGFKWKYK